MKLIVAVINSDDAPVVMNHISKAGFRATKLATTGGYLRVGNTTAMIGAEDEKIAEVLDIIRKYSKSRKQVVPSTGEFAMGLFPTVPVEVEVGGATVFVLDVDQFVRF